MTYPTEPAVADLTFATHNWATEIVVGHLLSHELPPLELVPIRQWGDPAAWLPFPSPSDLAVALRKHYTHAARHALGDSEGWEAANIFHQLLTVVLDQVNWDLVVARLAEDAKYRLSDAAVQGKKEFAKDHQGKTWEECIPPADGEKDGNGNIPPSSTEGGAK